MNFTELLPWSSQLLHKSYKLSHKFLTLLEFSIGCMSYHTNRLSSSYRFMTIFNRFFMFPHRSSYPIWLINLPYIVHLFTKFSLLKYFYLSNILSQKITWKIILNNKTSQNIINFVTYFLKNKWLNFVILTQLTIIWDNNYYHHKKKVS